MTAATTIPIAGFKEVYDVAAVDRALQELSPSANEALKATYEKMLKAGGARFAVKPSGVPVMDSLYEHLPNFSEVLDDIKKQIALCASSNDPLELPPVLLVGESGIGKTHFGRCLAQLLATGFGFVSMGAMTAGWILSGASSQWKNSKPGKVFDTLLHGSYANPVIVADEIDKAGADAQYDPLGALYGLLERDTASQFVDEFVEIPVDASGLVWIATANDAARIPEPILNRVNVYEIDAPDREGALRIAQSIYSEIRTGHDWGKTFPEAPAQAVLDGLADLGPREMRRALMTAFGNAKLAARDEILPGDLSENRAAKKQRIGF
ncbi:MAG TPA: AAA family ATPase [Burkholderiales bacterium]|nr:AAA family ATPase [Burkholderiales bacterium]